MTGKVFFSVSMSLDGFMAPGSLGDLMGQQWMELQQWIFPQRFFRENLKLGEGGEEGPDNDIVRETFERTGASVMGKRMFEAGEQAWPEDAPFHTPVFVVTHEKRDPWERSGGTTFHFVNNGIEAALDRAREAAGDRDVRIAGGGATIVEHVNAGLVERGLDAVVDEVEDGPTRPLPGVTLLVRHDEDRCVERRVLRPRRLAGVEHALAHHARAGALERLPHDVVVAPFLAAIAELQVLPEEPRWEDPLLQLHPLRPHQVLEGLGRDEPVQRHRHTEEHLCGHQSSTPFRAISVT